MDRMNWTGFYKNNLVYCERWTLGRPPHTAIMWYKVIVARRNLYLHKQKQQQISIMEMPIVFTTFCIYRIEVYEDENK